MEKQRYEVIPSEKLEKFCSSICFCGPYPHLPTWVEAKTPEDALFEALNKMDSEWYNELDGEYVKVSGPGGEAVHHFSKNPRYETMVGEFRFGGIKFIGILDNINGENDPEIGMDSIKKGVYLVPADYPDSEPYVFLSPYMPDDIIDAYIVYYLMYQSPYV